jgi:hypothetical protein
MSVATRPRIPAITSEYRMASVKASAAECLAARIPLAFDVLLPGLDCANNGRLRMCWSVWSRPTVFHRQ